MSYIKTLGANALTAIALTAAIFYIKNSDRTVANPQGNINNLTPAEVVEKTSRLRNEPVTVRGEIERLESNLAFKIKDKAMFATEEILVIDRSGKSLPKLPKGEDATLQVSGELSKFTWFDAVNEYNLDLPKNELTQYENRPVIYADRVVLSPSPGEISQEPEDYYYKTVAVKAEVEDIKGYGVFTLEENAILGGRDLLVILPYGLQMPRENKEVIVTGMLRPFTMANFERSYNLTWDLDLKKEIEAEYTNRPVLIAKEVATIDE